MIPGAFQQLTIVRLRYPSFTDHGTPRADYTATPARLPIEGCWAEPIESTEIVDGRLAVRTGWTIAGPEGIDVKANDHVELHGAEYGVTGDVLRIPSVTGTLRATKFTIVRWEG